jgi:hypothetical protein
MRKTQIIAMGGGGGSMEPDNPALDLYILAQTRKRAPSICFLATATGDADGYIEKFYTAFKAHRCRPSHVPLFRRTPDLKQALLTQDVIYVGGGNTKSMLAVWRDWDSAASASTCLDERHCAGRDKRRRHLLVQDGRDGFLGKRTDRAAMSGTASRHVLPSLCRRSGAQTCSSSPGREWRSAPSARART